MTPAGSRWAEQIFSSASMPNSSSCLRHASMSGRSDFEPRITPTSGTDGILCHVLPEESPGKSYSGGSGERPEAGLLDVAAHADGREDPAPGGDQALARHHAGAGVEDEDAVRHRAQTLDLETRAVALRIAARRHHHADRRPRRPLHARTVGQVAQ